MTELSRFFVTISVLALVGCRPPVVSETEVEPLRLAPAAVEFGEVWVGFEARQPLTVRNPSRVEQPLTLTVSGGFGAQGFPAAVAAGEEVSGWIALTATQPGEVEGVASVGDERVTVRASALAVPPCPASDACHLASFDFVAGRCVETVAPDDTACTASFSCFSEARCRAGQCVGTLTTCDDQNRCTLDACGEDGCVHPDDSLSCPLPSNPCLAPACDPQQGCTSVEVEDGTPCGPRACDTAAICLAGQCRTQAAPQTQSCTEVMAGVPAGPGFVDGTGLDARFNQVTSMVYLPNGDLYLADFDGTVGRIRRVSPDGTVRTVAGGTAGTRDGFGRQAQFSRPLILGLDPRGNLVIRDRLVGSGVLTSLRRMSPSGLVVTVCAQCLGDSRTETVLVPGGDVLSLSVGFAGPIIIERRTDLGRVSTRQTMGLSAFVVATISPDPLTVCGSVNGNTRLIHLEEDGPGGLLWQLGATCRAPRGNERAFADGGFELLAQDGPADDGPLNVVGLERAELARMAFEADGGYALFDQARFHVRRVEGGNMRTLAGPVPRRGNVDGAQSLLQTSPQALAADQSGVWFTDDDRLRRLEARVVTTLADAGSVGRDLTWTGTGVVWLGGATVNGFFVRTDQLATFDPSGSLVSARTTVRNDLRSVAWQSDGGLLVAHDGENPGGADDAGYEPFFASSRIRSGGVDPRAYVVVNVDQGELFTIGPNENWTKPFLQPDAGQRLLRDFYELTPHVLIGISGRRIVRRDVATGQQTVLAELSENPTAIAPAPDGGAFVAVPHAILRVRF